MSKMPDEVPGSAMNAVPRRATDGVPGGTLERRAFVAGTAVAGLAVGAALVASVASGCSTGLSPLPTLPASSPDPDGEFEIDRNINMDTIDQYLGRNDVAYRDVRMFIDSSEPLLEDVLEGFKLVPYPFLASLPNLSFSGDYEGEKLVFLDLDDKGTIRSSRFIYEEASLILEDLFPRDKAIFLTCGGGGYAWMTRALLIHLGWDASRIYNVGGMRAYRGSRVTELTIHASQAGKNNVYATWRADYAIIDFGMLHKVR
jgi:hypothetical protein